MPDILFPLLSILPLGLLALIVRLIRGRERAHTGCRDFGEQPAPGQFSRGKLELLAKQVQDVIALALALALLLGASFLFSIRHETTPPPAVLLAHLGLAVLVYACLLVRLTRLLDERHFWGMKLRGQTLVAGELNHLQSANCRVFHDLPLLPDASIDHVVVGPSGVYLVQTTYRRTGRACPIQRRHEVVYDGLGVRFPGRGSERDLLGEARRRAEHLSEFLSEALEERIAVQPVIALPGWLIRRETEDRLGVLNEYEFHRLGAGAPAPALGEDEASRIARELERLCDANSANFRERETEFDHR